jgi:hypothetical protein
MGYHVGMGYHAAWDTYPELGILRELGWIDPIAEHLRRNESPAALRSDMATCNTQHGNVQHSM